MSTLAEIEAAVDTLTAPEQEQLLRTLRAKLSSRVAPAAQLVFEDGRAVLVAPPNAPPMTPEYVRVALADFP
jgi:hypothetical protein